MPAKRVIILAVPLLAIALILPSTARRSRLVPMLARPSALANWAAATVAVPYQRGSRDLQMSDRGGNVSIVDAGFGSLGGFSEAPGLMRLEHSMQPWIAEVQIPIVIPYDVRLPLVLRGYFPYAAPCGPTNAYCEDYDGYQNAYGPLGPDMPYTAYPDDINDYYYFWLPIAGAVTVHVSGYEENGQVIVREDDEFLTEIAKDAETPEGDGEMRVEIPYLSAGKYYIQLYTAPGDPVESAYTLTVSY